MRPFNFSISPFIMSISVVTVSPLNSCSLVVVKSLYGGVGCAPEAELFSVVRSLPAVGAWALLAPSRGSEC